MSVYRYKGKNIINIMFKNFKDILLVYLFLLDIGF